MSGLIGQIDAMNYGRCLEDVLDGSPAEFCIDAAGYPEKHVDAPSLSEDVAGVTQKVDAGAGYVVTQMLFEKSTVLLSIRQWPLRTRGR